ncbi:MAG: hypothetical protein ACNS62_10845 [Candidatus Cyclobacteriaceae bacterium M3_2C_046]
MKTQKQFKFSRFYNLIRYKFIENRQQMLVVLGGFSVAVMILLFLIQRANQHSVWETDDYMKFFLVLYIFSGVIYAGYAFSSFRNKEKTINYLMIPASSLEKFLFEFISRIIFFMLGMPLLFWLLANLEYGIGSLILPDFLAQPFSWREAYNLIFDQEAMVGWKKLAFILTGALVLIIPFTGASYFKKYPLLKSLISFGLIIGTYILLGYLLIRYLDLPEYEKDNLLFISNEKQSVRAGLSALILLALGLLSVTYFKIREKEV